MIKDKPGMIVTTLSAKFYKSLEDRIRIDRAAEFMRAYEQQGPWPDMLRGWDLTYSLLLHPLPEPRVYYDMDLAYLQRHVHAAYAIIGG